MAENTKIPVIPDDALVDIQISGSFHRKLAKAALALGEARPPEDYKKALETLKDKNPENLYELTVNIIVAVLFEVETSAKKQNKVKLIDIDETSIGN